MNAGRIVNILLDGEEDMVKHLGRLAVDPMYEITDAMQKNQKFDKVFRAPDPWSYELRIVVNPSDSPGSKLRQIVVWYNRSKESQETHLHSPNERGHWYGSFDVKNVESVAKALKGLIDAAKKATIGNLPILYAMNELAALQWRSKNPIRRRRSRINPRWGV